MYYKEERWVGLGRSLYKRVERESQQKSEELRGEDIEEISQGLKKGIYKGEIWEVAGKIITLRMDLKSYEDLKVMRI